MIDILAKSISYGSKLGAEYVEIRAQNLFKTKLTTKDGVVEGAKEGIESGAGIRALVNGAWGFVSIGVIDSERLNRAIEDAVKLANPKKSLLSDRYLLAVVDK